MRVLNSAGIECSKTAFTQGCGICALYSLLMLSEAAVVERRMFPFFLSSVFPTKQRDNVP